MQFFRPSLFTSFAKERQSCLLQHFSFNQLVIRNNFKTLFRVLVPKACHSFQYRQAALKKTEYDHQGTFAVFLPVYLGQVYMNDNNRTTLFPRCSVGGKKTATVVTIR